MSTALFKYCETTGTAYAEIARRVGVKRVAVRRWALQGIPASRVPAVVQATGLAHHVLCPEFYPAPSDFPAVSTPASGFG